MVSISGRLKKRETESVIVAAQNQSIRTNIVKAKIIEAREILYVECVKK